MAANIGHKAAHGIRATSAFGMRCGHSEMSGWLVIISLCGLLLLPLAANASDPCHPRDPLLQNPYVDRVAACVAFLKRTVSSPDSRAFAEKLIPGALTDKGHEHRAPGIPLNYFELAELVALLNDPRVVEAFLTFIARSPGSADEVRSLAVARLYELGTPLVLRKMAERGETERQVVIFSVAWGLANNHYPFIIGENYRRFSVGTHWEVLDDSHPHRAIARQVEDKLREVLTAKQLIGVRTQIWLIVAESVFLSPGITGREAVRPL